MITSDEDNLMRQAPMTVNNYLNEVVKMLDEKFGEGYASKNMYLVGKLTECCCRDYEATLYAKRVQGIDEAIGYLADKLNDFEFIINNNIPD
jgi:hypothetical protein